MCGISSACDALRGGDVAAPVSSANFHYCIVVARCRTFVSGPSFASTLGLRRRPLAADSTLRDVDYVAAGKRANDAEFRQAAEQQLFRLWQEEEGYDWFLAVPFAFKQLIDLHAAMRHAVAVVGEKPQPLTHHSLFHPVFAAFALGFAQGLVTAHRRKHLRWHGESGDLTRMQQEQCDNWGIEIATYYIAALDAFGIFGKATDVELYGISDKWWTLGDAQRVEAVAGVHDCVQTGRLAAEHWSDDERVDVAMQLAEVLDRVITAASDVR